MARGEQSPWGVQSTALGKVRLCRRPSRRTSRSAASTPRRHRRRRSAPRATTTSAGVVRREQHDHRVGLSRGCRGRNALQALRVPALDRLDDHVRCDRSRASERVRFVASPAFPGSRECVRCSALASSCIRSIDAAISSAPPTGASASPPARRATGGSAAGRDAPHRNSTREPPWNFSQPPIAMMPIAPVRATWVPPHADRSKSSTSISRSVPVRTDSFRSGSAAASSAVAKRIVDRPVFPHDAIGLVFGRRDLRRRDLAREVDRRRRRRRGGSSRCARRTADRTPPTARAGRCAAACGRTGAPSRSAPLDHARRPERCRSMTCTTRAVVSIDHVADRGAAEGADVEWLPAGRRIERRLIERRRRSASVNGSAATHGGVERSVDRVGVVQPWVMRRVRWRARSAARSRRWLRRSAARR